MLSYRDPVFRFAIQAVELDDREAVISAARQAEDFGYEELYSYDHLGTVDPFIPLVVAAEATSQLRLGPLVLNNEFHHPALLARTAATFDRMTGGRLVLGVGTGYAKSEHDATNIELRTPSERVGRLGESLDRVEVFARLGDRRDGGTPSPSVDLQLRYSPCPGACPASGRWSWSTGDPNRRENG